MATSDPLEAFFHEQSTIVLEAICCAKNFKETETNRLKAITDNLLKENDTLRGNLGSSDPALSKCILDILHEVPMKSLSTPSTAMFDDLMPKLADYEIEFEDDFGQHEAYRKIITDFRRLQASENGFDQAAKTIQTLAIDNYILRLKTIALAGEEEQQGLLHSHGDPFNAKLFHRKVPNHVSTMQSSGPQDYSISFEEFRHANDQKSLVLKALKPGPIAGSFYHYSHSIYIPPLWAQGVPYNGNDPVWEISSDGYLHCLAGFKEIGGGGDQKLWIPDHAVLWIFE